MQNATINDKEGNHIQAVVVGENPDGSAELTYQAGGKIHTVTAEKKRDGTYKVREEKA